MECFNKKCSLKKHEKDDANSYCQECNIYMCKKCESYHSELFQSHNLIKISLDKEGNYMFTGVCKIENHHPNKLEFYCNDHNELCCASCVTKMKGKGYGQHMDCDICFIENIK